MVDKGLVSLSNGDKKIKAKYRFDPKKLKKMQAHIKFERLFETHKELK